MSNRFDGRVETLRQAYISAVMARREAAAKTMTKRWEDARDVMQILADAAQQGHMSAEIAVGDTWQAEALVHIIKTTMAGYEASPLESDVGAWTVRISGWANDPVDIVDYSHRSA